MKRNVAVIVAVLGVTALVAAAALAASILRAPEAPSGELTALPVLPSPEAMQSTQEGAPEDTPPAVTSGLLVFELAPAESEARFSINEVLYGEDKTVVGVSNAVAAQILIDPANPANAQVGTVQVNARTFFTDSGSRNRAIQNFILQTGAFEFVTFTPTQLDGLPDSAAVGDTFSFTMTGDLTIRNITRPVTFNVSVTAESEGRIRGLASAPIAREDFNLQIPSVPQVAWVDEIVLLELEFVALAQD